jgi:hypothetical protein
VIPSGPLRTHLPLLLPFVEYNSLDALSSNLYHASRCGNFASYTSEAMCSQDTHEIRFFSVQMQDWSFYIIWFQRAKFSLKCGYFKAVQPLAPFNRAGFLILTVLSLELNSVAIRHTFNNTVNVYVTLFESYSSLFSHFDTLCSTKKTVRKQLDLTEPSICALSVVVHFSLCRIEKM